MAEEEEEEEEDRWRENCQEVTQGHLISCLWWSYGLKHNFDVTEAAKVRHDSSVSLCDVNFALLRLLVR